MKKLLLFLLLLFPVFFLLAQEDSTILFAERLLAKDIRTDIVNTTGQKITSVGVSFQQLEDLPFTVYVITKEDIRNNGYNTLVDALKMVPSIRVSQPGSGADGETFLMRGLKGNTYAKIMINNVPVKPMGVRGMPIGAQLPIKQAERIEVIFGPIGTLYGADASAGVINIVLKESERPLYTKADIGFGAEGYSSMNILFGGKLGKKKQRVLKYNVYGSYTSIDNQRVFLEDGAIGGLYDPKSYDSDSTYKMHPNFLNLRNNDESGNVAPHLSRMFGIELNYGRFALTLSSMYRRDHSSLGLNPAAYSFVNPLNFIGETMRQAHLSYRRKKEKSTFSMSFNLLGLESDNTSSYRMLNNEFSQALVAAANADQISLTPLAERINQYYDNFVSRNRYVYENKVDISLETIWNFKIRKNIYGIVGFTPRALLSTSEYFLRTPYPNNFEDHTVSSPNSVTDSYEIDGFAQLFYDGRKIKVLLGLQSNFSSSALAPLPSLFPRVALLYKVNSKLSFRGFIGRAFRNPTTYFTKNSYTIKVQNYNIIRLGVNSLLPEINVSREIGFRWHPQSTITIDLALFSSETLFSINPGVQYEENEFTNTIETITLGYFNDLNSFSKIHGVQSAISWRNIIPLIKLNASFNFTYSIGEAFLNNRKEDFIREQPDIIGQLKLSFSPWKDIFIHLDNLYISEAKHKLILTGDLAKYNTLPSYYTLDMSIIAHLTAHFQVNFKLKNALDKSYAGLAASGTTDDLFWNQQSFRTWELSFSYRME